MIFQVGIYGGIPVVNTILKVLRDVIKEREEAFGGRLKSGPDNRAARMVSLRDRGGGRYQALGAHYRTGAGYRIAACLGFIT